MLKEEQQYPSVEVCVIEILYYYFTELDIRKRSRTYADTLLSKFAESFVARRFALHHPIPISPHRR
ncbi:MAG TPA: hypothetical protein VIQ31_06090 [Phormidium sp.]